ncbi:MAG: peptide chain release factor N(5)-glutamine methyltransferase [Pseudomonadaceae bacterium]|nr:peptide chain release factor N(5)-glutamine methyltransferase [Pseudomonadaceae bacterium]
MTTVRQWLQQTSDLPLIECELLLGEVMVLSRAQILAYPDRAIPANALQQLQPTIEQLRAGQPFAYITGEREFWGLNFRVTADVLIPRPETELLVELVVELAPQGGNVVDLGTGSGAIAIAVKSERPDLAVTAVDKSGAALKIARHNACRLKADIAFHQQSWLQGSNAVWDIVVSNPPYIAERDPHLAALRAEPRLALVAGTDGLDAIRQIIPAASKQMHQNGYLLIEHGFDQAESVQQLMSVAGLANVHSRKDLAGINRVTLAQYAGR